jgi:hypothetical protein
MFSIAINLRIPRCVTISDIYAVPDPADPGLAAAANDAFLRSS